MQLLKALQFACDGMETVLTSTDTGPVSVCGMGTVLYAFTPYIRVKTFFI
jgi:hypothetical protein